MTNQYQIVGKVDGSTIYPMEQPDYGRPMPGDVVTLDGHEYHEVRGGYGTRNDLHLWLLADVPAAIKAVCNGR